MGLILTKLGWFQHFVKSQNSTSNFFEKKNQIFGFPCCSTDINKARVIYFPGYGQTNTVLESSYGNMSAHMLSRNWSFYYYYLNKLSFSDTTVIEGGRERKHSWDLKSLILGDTLQLLTPLPRTGMFSKIWRAILVEVAGPKAPHRMILQTSHLLRTIIYFYKTPPSKGPVLYLIGEMKSSSSSSNYPFANLKSFNRTPKR